MNAIESMEDHLCLPKNSGFKFNDLFQTAMKFEKLLNSNAKISKICFLYWLDSFGDFTEEKGVYNKIVNKMFMSLPPKDIMEIVPFIDYHKE